ncbi:hypothetical protein FQ142_15965 [Microbacterium sp. ANT_H45B]|uniref:hypothetical protein n=1 Tax=Microbacterium sp. ANT_H45B TaxID=2597346 RepID=UPI0011ED469F|nr:hypothetical protein [Microbacterium sp. ANT_H45B]KAA0960320.1 hypothetical protein FQ142_15965 [Microbacterium sp. ANT_H45B]
MVGFAIALGVLSPWLVLLGRAVYRDGPALQRWIWNAAPLWGPVTTGVVLLHGVGTMFGEWSGLCLPHREWNATGVVIIGIGFAVALIAAAQMVFGRVRVGDRTRKNENSGDTSESGVETSPRRSPADEVAPPARRRNMPIEQRRVIVAYVLTYVPAAIVIIVGVGLL